ncbi:hypothetical protein RhiJN_22709 [Ceratobasidium sp. AG-Ba]|nr:hypothetical protein RhiJN_22709 [Ceratobasidium sp. AG-Ba]
MDPHPYLVELAQAGSSSLRAGLVNVPPHERDFLEAWCRETLTNYSRNTTPALSRTTTPPLSRTPSSLVGMISPHTDVGSTSGFASPLNDSLVMSPGPNGGCKDMLMSIPLEAVLYELELIIEECKTGGRSISEILDRPSTPLSFRTITSSSGTISSTSTPRSAFFQPYTSNMGLSPMQQLIAQGPRHTAGVQVKSIGRARAGSFAVRGVV